jgi:intracellular sulfur oxidation DsrE/DsrF family protein
MSSPTPRRGFLASLATAAAALGLPMSAHAAVRADDDRALLETDPWLARLTAPQKVIFHTHEPKDGLALLWTRTFLNTHRDTYKRADTESSVVVGLQGKAIGFAFTDAMWAKYPVGETLEMKSGEEFATRNIFASHHASDGEFYRGATIPELQARGVTVLVCNNSLRNSASRFLRERPITPARSTAFYEELKANLLPNVFVVPAMIVALEMAQSRGCRYVYAG